MSNWETYHQKTREKPPRPFMLEALEYVKNKSQALDLGAGAMTDSEHLATEFQTVTAVDIEPSAVNNTENEKINVVIASFQDAELPEGTYDFINAQFSLPFIDRADFDQTMEKIKSSLADDGIMCGQFFGDKDEWNKGGKKMTFLTEPEAREVLSDLEIVEFREEERDSKPVVGDVKHWHLFHFIARKPA